jgi:hypothetical protein
MSAGERGGSERLLDRYRHLQELKRRVDAELIAVESGLLVAGVLSKRGRRPIAPTHTIEEAREAHRRWAAGETDDPWVKAGERQYQRDSKRRRRAA